MISLLEFNSPPKVPSCRPCNWLCQVMGAFNASRICWRYPQDLSIKNNNNENIYCVLSLYRIEPKQKKVKESKERKKQAKVKRGSEIF